MTAIEVESAVAERPELLAGAIVRSAPRYEVSNSHRDRRPDGLERSAGLVHGRARIPPGLSRQETG
jgi:hypothetical protein